MSLKNLMAGVLLISSLSSQAEDLQFTNTDFPINLPAPKQTNLTLNKIADAKASEIFNNYLKAIGGINELKKIKTFFVTANMEIQGTAIALEMKGHAPNLENVTMSVNGNVVMKTNFDGATGYTEQGGNKLNLTPEEVKERNQITYLFEQLDYLNNPAFKAEVKGTENINGSDAYKVLVTYPSGKVKSEYYDVKSKLLVKKEETTDKNNASVTTSQTYNDYKKVGNILFPFTNTLTISSNGQQQVMEMKATVVKINEEVSLTDFK